MLKRKVGRPKGAISKKRATAMEAMVRLEAELGRSVSPLEGLLRLGSDPAQPVSVRVQCMSECLPYIWPKLQNQALAVTRDDDPAETTVDITSIIMASPELVDAAQRLSVAFASEPSQTGPADERKALSEGDRNFTEDLARQPNGHWAK